MKHLCPISELSLLCGGKSKKKTVPLVETEEENEPFKNETITLKCRRKGTSPETVEFIKNIVVGALNLLFYPFT
jgi:hypothetical protein